MAKRVRYTNVNATWPEALPIPTGPEAISAAKRLYRMAMGKAYKGKWQLTSGRRYTWQRSGTFSVNPNHDGGTFNGWRALVHDLSHYCHSRLHPDKPGHDHRHEYLEKEMIRHVIERGWLDGKLRRPEKPTPNVKEVRYQRVCDRIASWERKRKRADTALKKLERTKTYYERQGAVTKS